MTFTELTNEDRMTLNANKLSWQQLITDLSDYYTIFQQVESTQPLDPLCLQPRLYSALSSFCRQQDVPFMLVAADETSAYLSLLKESALNLLPKKQQVIGCHYQLLNDKVTCTPAQTIKDNFAAKKVCEYAEWIEQEELFGCLRQNKQNYQLCPGLVHRLNGGTLVLPIKTILTQPHLWLRLKQIVTTANFHWYPPDSNKPLPIDIPDMPISLHVILVGTSLSLAEFQSLEPTLFEQSIYAEYEAEMLVYDEQTISQWCNGVRYHLKQLQIELIEPEAWRELIYNGNRYCEDQDKLPLSPDWIRQQLIAAKHCSAAQRKLTAESFIQARNEKNWLEGYLVEYALKEIEQGIRQINTQGSIIGQINGLSVLEYPGHPRPFGEVCRISCVSYMGDNEITDIERKAELAGNIHAKGMMIMQALVTSELSVEQPLPFSASIVFEQSYSEVDGDSASLAVFCAYISTLSQQPINQQISVTGSIDQFGHVQAIGGINEKIEAFYDACQLNELTGQQGVIIPHTNIRHLCLKPEVIQAVKEGKFSIWSVQHVEEAIPLLMNLPYRQQHDETSVLSLIQTRVETVTQEQKAKNSIFPHWWISLFKRS